MLLQNLDKVATNVRSRLRGNHEKTSPYLLSCTGVLCAWFLEHSGSKSSNYVHSLPRICRWYKSSLLRKDNVKRKMLGKLKKSDVRRVMNIFSYCSMSPAHREDYAERHKIPDEDAKLIEDFLHNDIADNELVYTTSSNTVIYEKYLENLLFNGCFIDGDVDILKIILGRLLDFAEIVTWPILFEEHCPRQANDR
ncbi:hypothetical protein Taro_036350, partial [Colocasia esculenta]|nr:hypothetical protein [Colocasia esculenta]